MKVLNLFGLLFSILGVIYLAFGFQIEKTKSDEEGMEFYLEGKLPIVLKNENSFLRIFGWICLGFGNFLQIISIFLN